jgi:hypothetical protein
MPPKVDEWQQVQEELGLKLRDPKLARLRPMLENLGQMLTANPRPFGASDARASIALIEQMNAQLTQKSVNQVLDAASSGTLTFDNPQWKPETVNQAQFILQNIVNAVGPEIRAPVPEPIRVPIVLVVMTGAQAEQALDKSAFANHPDSFQENFLRLCEELNQKGSQDWRSWYADQIPNWRPRGGAQTIGEIVQEVLAELQGDYEEQLVPRFWDIGTVAHADNWKVLQDLRKEGCVVIVDSLSLRHPAILRAFQQSLLDAYYNVSVLAIAPISNGWDGLREMTVVLQFHLTEMEFYKRKKDFRDLRIAELTDIEDFRRRFLDQVERCLEAKGQQTSSSLRGSLKVK